MAFLDSSTTKRPGKDSRAEIASRPSGIRSPIPSPHLFDVKAIGEPVFERIAKPDAAVAVVVPLYNYEDFIGECVKSIADQDLEELSLIIVDDHSTDSSLDRAVDAIEEVADRFSVSRIIRHRRNQGPSMARNTGLAWSDEPYVFMLDADNRIRPPALSRLLEAISNSGAEFAYSQMCKFGAVNGLGLADIWSVQHLLVGPYIDMMALIKRQALVKAGGVVPLADDVSWEDHDLWCRFAELGFRGVFLPELLCEYRIHDSARSLGTGATVDPFLSAEIALRHPALFAHRAAAGKAARCLTSDPIDAEKPIALDPRRTGSRPFRASLRAHPAWPELEPLLREFFDPAWYQQKYPDLDLEHIDLFDHFVVHGARELRDPCGEFQTSFYLARHPDVAQTGEIPVVHYLLRGRSEGRPTKIYHVQEFDIPSGYQIAGNTAPSPKRVCILLHLYHIDLFDELATYIDNVTLNRDIFVNLVDETWTLELHDKINRRWPFATVIVSPDHGRDIGGFSRLLSLVDFPDYDLFLFIHSKKSPHLLDYQGNAWRRSLLDAIVGSPATASACIEGMRAAPNIGITGAKKWRDFNVYANNRKYGELLEIAQISANARDCEFVAGTMFFIRAELVKRLYSVLRRIVFEDGTDRDLRFHVDGQYAHSVERLIGNLVRDEGLCFWWM